MSKPKQPTPEEIEEMRKVIAEHDAKVAEARTRERRAAAQPFLDIVDGDGFKALEADLPNLVELADTIRDIRVHVDALSAGMFGLRQQSSFLTGAAITPIVTPGGKIAPAQVVIEQPVGPEAQG